MEVQFLEDNGLLVDGELVADFCPEVVEIRKYLYLKTNKEKKMFRVKILKKDGTETEIREIEKLDTISYFEMWNVPDIDLSTRQKKILIYKMQLDAASVETKRILVVGQGMYCYEDNCIYQFGNNLFLCGSLAEYEIKCQKQFPLLQHGNEPCKDARKYINAFPGVSEPLFYGALFAVLKPIVCEMGYAPDFAIALVGPSGHLKTTLARLYGEWGIKREEQEASFRDFRRMKDILKMVDEIPGQNFLVDDLHESHNSYAKEKQSEWLDIIIRHIGQQQNCANVIIMGESLEKMGIFSCKDRILQIRISKMDSDSLKEKKLALNGLARGDMASIAQEFLGKIMCSYDEVRSLIKDFFAEHDFVEDVNYDTRTYRHGLFIKLTEQLFRKYMCHGLERESGKEALENALKRNYDIQQKELMWERKKDSGNDYVADVDVMLNAKDKYLKAISFITQYQNCNDNESFYVSAGKVCITRSALQNGMMKFYRRAISVKEIVDALHNAGILEEDSNTRTKKFNGLRHYIISLEMLENYKKWSRNSET